MQNLTEWVWFLSCNCKCVCSSASARPLFGFRCQSSEHCWNCSYARRPPQHLVKKARKANEERDVVMESWLANGNFTVSQGAEL